MVSKSNAAYGFFLLVAACSLCYPCSYRLNAALRNSYAALVSSSGNKRKDIARCFQFLNDLVKHGSRDNCAYVGSFCKRVSAVLYWHFYATGYVVHKCLTVLHSAVLVLCCRSLLCVLAAVHSSKAAQYGRCVAVVVCLALCKSCKQVVALLCCCVDSCALFLQSGYLFL